MAFLEDPIVKEKFANAKKLSEVDAAGYDAVYYPGGNAPVFGLPTDPSNIELVNQASLVQKCFQIVD